MPISAKDREFMEQVAAYYRRTKSSSEPDGSIRDTAIKFDINRNKVRKILITMGELKSPITDSALLMRKQGMSIQEISNSLGISVATVSTALPYEDKIDNSLEPTKHASDVREYRAYEREQLQRQARRQLGSTKKITDQSDVWKENTMAGGKTNDKECQQDFKKEENINCELELMRLHLELYDEYASDMIDVEETDIFKRYGKLEYGRSISRDIIVPVDIPLYALHYVIQKAFGWQNSHLHRFELPEERFKALTANNASVWTRMVGVLFRSPLMDEGDEFWTDDYNGGSFKNWLRKKYTGPYLSECHGEGIFSCRKDMLRLDMNADYYVMYSNAFNSESRKYDGEEYVSGVTPVYDWDGNKRPEPKPWYSDEAPYRIEVVKFGNIPSEGLRFVFERFPMALLERLPIYSLLAADKPGFPENGSFDEQTYIDDKTAGPGSIVYSQLERYIQSVIRNKIDSPLVQVQPPMPVTDVLLYSYDFGDNWKIRITASESCTDLVESGRITQAELDKAIAKCRETYRPVLIAKDGDMLIDDVGGIHGFADFLQKINPVLKGLDPDGKEEAKREKKEYLEWARSQGWHRDKATNLNLL